MIRQLEAPTYTEDQLNEEVREAYIDLAEVEGQQHAESKVDLSHDQWLVLILRHQALLDEHHDFLLLSQHPSAGCALKDLADRYEMPARMWRHGIYSFLELLRRKLSGSMEYMLSIIYFSYTRIDLLLESVPLSETWIECLGDLPRYRKVVGPDMDPELWAEAKPR
ncbi:hypothetical protein N7471_010578 [Penicillium samsonianum]|uniref:uncharacterized protein n=1 Tax=Penicillium samsonianum TaxID=1882272 RepID=UPI002548F901|nr:uncharacterized protein N7471_010578 [Penicillium samsonianum]KAJ6126085.1 hypothetical protein N7471_010578 [Penicillium samsonianum]